VGKGRRGISILAQLMNRHARADDRVGTEGQTAFPVADAWPSVTFSLAYHTQLVPALAPGLAASPAELDLD
jgi:hypothetical protein